MPKISNRGIYSVWQCYRAIWVKVVASTTLLALVEAGANRIVSTNDEIIIRKLIENGYLLVSDVFAGGFDNSPTQIRRAGPSHE